MSRVYCYVTVANVCIPRSFLLINVCNPGKTLCSPCRRCQFAPGGAFQLILKFSMILWALRFRRIVYCVLSWNEAKKTPVTLRYAWFWEFCERRGLITAMPDFLFLLLHQLRRYVYWCCFAPFQGGYSTIFRVVMKVPVTRTISQLSRTQYTRLNI